MESNSDSDLVRASGPFSLRALPSHSDEYDAYESVLYRSEEDTGLVVDGVYLCGQYAVGDRCLLFIEDQVMLEESLYIYLIDSAMVVLDKLTISSLYASATLEDLSAESKSSFVFQSLGRHWTLRVLQAPCFYFPLFGMPGYVKRVRLWKSYFVISNRIIDTTLIKD
ncbi:MAG: hypothetical protein GKS00_01135 [Alphaproteobacteria bacterium]|nr:hypothetical protein [Alphaproteobacteria bacterium]